jgi:hypothetical protein
MSEKEKAEELYSQMYRILFHTNADPIHCKQCALTAIDELIEQEQKYNNGSFYPSNYWNKVKTELEKL